MGSPVLHRNLLQRPPIAMSHDHGAFIQGEDGRLILDVSAGAGVTALGYGVRSISDAIAKTASEMPYVHSSNWSTPAVEQLARDLLMLCGPAYKGGAVTFFNSGAEANEAAIKIAAQYNGELLKERAALYYAREHSYHGNTVFMLQLGDHPRGAKYSGLVIRHPYVNHFPSFRPNAFCAALPNPEAGLDQLAGQLSDDVAGKHRQAVVIIETIGGTTVGIEPPTISYLNKLQKICDTFGVILIVDEVLGGQYRTGELMAWQHYKNEDGTPCLHPDIITMGKGLTGGYFPLSCAIVAPRIHRAMATQSGKFWHSSTNQNHPIGCAAGVAALREYRDGDEQRQKLTDYMEQNIIPMLASNKDLIHSVSGVGTLWGIRLNPTALNLHIQVKRKLRERGVAVYTDGGTVFGLGNMLLFAPPYCIDPMDLETAAIKIIGCVKDSV